MTKRGDGTDSGDHYAPFWWFIVLRFWVGGILHRRTLSQWFALKFIDRNVYME
jgi:hypothetical protein